MNRFINEFQPQETDVTVCGSMTHKDKWLGVVEELKSKGLRVATPDLSEKTDWSQLTEGEVIEQKGWLVRRHIANIASTKAVLICNYEKQGKRNYIGSNTFLEMGVAFAYGKPVYVLHKLPEQDNREEMLALESIELEGNIEKLVEEVTK